MDDLFVDTNIFRRFLLTYDKKQFSRFDWVERGCVRGRFTRYR